MRKAMDEGTQRRSGAYDHRFCSDLCDIRRIEEALERFDTASRSAASPSSSGPSDGRASRAASYAKKVRRQGGLRQALGTGIRRGVHWKDMGVVNLPTGQPTMKLTGGRPAGSPRSRPPGHEARVHLTITDEFPLAWRRSSSRRPVAERRGNRRIGPSALSGRRAVAPRALGMTNRTQRAREPAIWDEEMSEPLGLDAEKTAAKRAEGGFGETVRSSSRLC